MKNIFKYKYRWFFFLTIVVFCLPIIAVVILFNLPGPNFVIEPPRPHFWNYPIVNEARFKTEITQEGTLKIELHHPILKGVTPEMLSWWYRNLASGKATLEGVEYTYYHLFHLSEHGQTHILSPATDGSSGMGVGAIVYRQEKFGPYLSKGQARVEEFNSNGFVVKPIMGPLSFGKIQHIFKSVESGTEYSVFTELGSDAPLIAPILNYYITHKQFAPDVVKEWIRHQVEEVGSLVHFLPKLYNKNNP